MWMPSFSCLLTCFECHHFCRHSAAEKEQEGQCHSVCGCLQGVCEGHKNNRLSDDNIRRIVSAVAERKDEQHFARLVPNDEVGSKQNNYNLSVSTYVEQEDTREKIDIVKLNAEIAEIVAREQKLREEIDRIIGEIEG